MFSIAKPIHAINNSMVSFHFILALYQLSFTSIFVNVCNTNVDENFNINDVYLQALISDIYFVREDDA